MEHIKTELMDMVFKYAVDTTLVLAHTWHMRVGLSLSDLKLKVFYGEITQLFVHL